MRLDKALSLKHKVALWGALAFSVLQCSGGKAVEFDLDLEPGRPLVSLADLTRPDPYPENDVDESKDVKAPWMLVGVKLSNNEEEKYIVVQSIEYSCEVPLTSGGFSKFTATVNPGEQDVKECAELGYMLFVPPDTDDRDFVGPVPILDDDGDDTGNDAYCGTYFYIPSGVDKTKVKSFVWSCKAEVIGWAGKPDTDEALGYGDDFRIDPFIIIDERLNKTIYFTTK